MGRILYIAPFCHIPPVHGASQRGINLLRALARHHEMTLLTYRKHDAAALQSWCDEHNIACRWLPEAPGRREAVPFARLLARYPSGFSSHDPTRIAATIDILWAEQGPFDILFFATQVMGQAVLIKRWPSQHILDLYDIYAPIAKAKSRQLRKTRPYHWIFRIEAWRIAHYERQIFGTHDLLLATSQDDLEQLGCNGAIAPVVVIPNGVTLPQVSAVRQGEPIVLMVGSYTYAPNAEGFLWFYTNVWPSIRAHVPQATLMLIGEGNQALHQTTSGDRSVQWVGKVDSLEGYYQQSSCVIVPILSGSGTRLKLLEAMAWGVPTVATTIGAQGVDHAGSVAIADEPKRFAKAVLERLQRPDEFRSNAEQARAIVAGRYTWDGIGDTLLKTIDQLIQYDQST